MKTDKDIMKIAYSMARRYPVNHMVDHDDMVQEAMITKMKDINFMNHWTTGIFYSHLRTYQRQFIPETKKYHTDIDDVKLPYETVDDITNHMDVDKFMAWIPNKKKPMFELYLQGYNTREIADELGCTKQNIDVGMKRTIKKYQEVING